MVGWFAELKLLSHTFPSDDRSFVCTHIICDLCLPFCNFSIANPSYYLMKLNKNDHNGIINKNIERATKNRVREREQLQWNKWKSKSKSKENLIWIVPCPFFSVCHLLLHHSTFCAANVCTVTVQFFLSSFLSSFILFSFFTISFSLDAQISM